jgi:hypothetical protein
VEANPLVEGGGFLPEDRADRQFVVLACQQITFAPIAAPDRPGPKERESAAPGPKNRSHSPRQFVEHTDRIFRGERRRLRANRLKTIGREGYFVPLVRAR